MALTTYPVQWQEWFVNQLVQKNNMIAQGLVQLDTTLIGAEKRVRTPIFKSLSTLGNAPSTRAAGNTLTTQALTDTSELAPVINRWDGIYNYGITAELQGKDALEMLKYQIPEVVSRDIQNALYSLTKGAFVSALTSHTYNALTESAPSTTISYELLNVAAQHVLGETMTNLTAVVMNSKSLTDAINKGMATWTSSAGYDLATGGRLAQMFGMKVITNDTLCASYTSGENTIYPVFLVGGTPWKIQWQKNLSYELYRIPTTDQNNLIWHYSFSPSIPGTSYIDATDTPTNIELLTATFTKTAENDSDIKLVKIETVGA